MVTGVSEDDTTVICRVQQYKSGLWLWRWRR